VIRVRPDPLVWGSWSRRGDTREGGKELHE